MLHLSCLSARENGLTTPKSTESFRLNSPEEFNRSTRLKSWFSTSPSMFGVPVSELGRVASAFSSPLMAVTPFKVCCNVCNARLIWSGSSGFGGSEGSSLMGVPFSLERLLMSWKTSVMESLDKTFPDAPGLFASLLSNSTHD